MRPIANTMQETDTLEGEEVNFTIGDARWVMRSMADLYSNRELAVIREYSTNARDAHVEAGKASTPIQVTLPNAMNPYFTVQDFGVGMSETELKEVYTSFGNSTKRDGANANDFNGMLGFGSKSAVAYTNTFTVTSVKNNCKTVAVVTRKPDFSIVLKIVLSGIETKESNGVTIQVPVHNWREFEQKAKDFYRFWLPGTIEVNGSEPKWAVGDKIGDNLYYYPQEGTSYVVMGNVAYRINNPDALFPRGMNKISFVAYVDNGAVEFTPSREDLKYSDHTKNALHKVINDFIANAVALAKKEIAEAKTHAEAYNAWAKWRITIGAGQVDDLTFKGDKLVEKFAIKGYRYDMNSTRYGTWTINDWPVEHVKNAVFVVDFGTQLTSSHKKKVKEWMTFKGLSGRYIIFTADKISSPWVDQTRVVDWETVKAETPRPAKTPRTASTAPGRKAGTFDLVSKDGRSVEQDVPSTQDLYYMMVQEYNSSRQLNTVLDEFDIDHEVVLVPANRKDKFLRFYPHAKPIMAHLESKINLDGPSLISAEGKVFMLIHHSDKSGLMALKSKDIQDPALVTLIDIVAKGEGYYLKEYKRQHRLASVLGIAPKFKKHTYSDYSTKFTKYLTENYPLAHNMYFQSGVKNGGKMYQHYVLYINGVYNAKKAGNRNV